MSNTHSLKPNSHVSCGTSRPFSVSQLSCPQQARPVMEPIGGHSSPAGQTYPSRSPQAAQSSTLTTAAAQQTPLRHFNQVDLARRWRMSARTLERWRYQRKGPAFLKIGGRIAYRTADVEAFEVARRRDGGLGLETPRSRNR